MSAQKTLSQEYVCGVPLDGGGRCRKRLTWGEPCPVHRSATFEQHPIPSPECVCEKPLVDIPEDRSEPPSCYLCGHLIPDRGGAQAGGYTPARTVAR